MTRAQEIPDPTQFDPDNPNELVYLFEILTFELAVLAILLLVLFGAFSWAILRAGRMPQPGALVTALSLLTFIAVLGFIFTQAESLVALAWQAWAPSKVQYRISTRTP